MEVTKADAGGFTAACTVNGAGRCTQGKKKKHQKTKSVTFNSQFDFYIGSTKGFEGVELTSMSVNDTQESEISTTPGLNTCRFTIKSIKSN